MWVYLRGQPRRVRVKTKSAPGPLDLTEGAQYLPAVGLGNPSTFIRCSCCAFFPVKTLATMGVLVPSSIS